MESVDVEGGAEMLKAIFLPFVLPSHIIPLVDMARLFAIHGIDVTIFTTTANATIFQSSIDRDSSRGRSIRTHVVKFPKVDGLPEGMECFNAGTPNDMFPKIHQGLCMLQGEFQQLFHDLKADFIVTDMFYPWSVDAAAELGIPRLMYLGASLFAHSAQNSLERFAPHTKVHSDTDTFLLPGLPHKIEMTRLQLHEMFRAETEFGKVMKEVTESERKSYGSIHNTYSELEGPYVEHYKKAMGTKCWTVGPVSLWVNQDASDKASRGNAKEGKEQEHACLTWLDSKKEGSVLYVSFGSMNRFRNSQLVEIAHALEDSGHDFIWVLRKNEEGEDDEGDFLGEFEKRVKASNKGYLIWGWAPQILILEHPATAAVVTHCGWNTINETVIAGLPLATWPLFAEQFFNEKLLVEVLRIAVPVGAKKWRNVNEYGDEIVKRESIGKAIALLMGDGEESIEIRRRAKVKSDGAKKAIQVGGSSHTNMKELIQELKSLKLQKVNHKMEAVG